MMACGVPATGNSLRVALFTPTSVAWADSSTAASNSNTVVYSNSVLGSGLAAFKVAKKGSICAVFMAGSVGRGRGMSAGRGRQSSNLRPPIGDNALLPVH